MTIHYAEDADPKFVYADVPFDRFTVGKMYAVMAGDGWKDVEFQLAHDNGSMHLLMPRQEAREFAEKLIEMLAEMEKHDANDD